MDIQYIILNIQEATASLAMAAVRVFRHEWLPPRVLENCVWRARARAFDDGIYDRKWWRLQPPQTPSMQGKNTSPMKTSFRLSLWRAKQRSIFRRSPLSEHTHTHTLNLRCSLSLPLVDWGSVFMGTKVRHTIYFHIRCRYFLLCSLFAPQSLLNCVRLSNTKRNYIIVVIILIDIITVGAVERKCSRRRHKERER